MKFPPAGHSSPLKGEGWRGGTTRFFPFLSELLSLLPATKPLWLVGGALRDLLLGKQHIPDIDLVVRDPLTYGRALARRTGGSFVVLDRRRRICRVAVSHSAIRIPQSAIQRWDLAPFGRRDIEANLSRRDFTVNAMALDLAVLRKRGEWVVVDPFGGLDDLRAHRMRVVRCGALAADPLRLLRAARFVGELGFSLDPDTRDAIIARAPLLSNAAPERRREELCRILASRYLEQAWEALDETGLRYIIFGDEQIAYGIGAIRQARDALRWLRRASRSLHHSLSEELEATFRRRELFLLATILREMGWGGDRGRQWARDLRFSRKAQERLGRLLDLPLADLRGGKAHCYRFLRQAREVEVEAILLARITGKAAWSRQALAFYRGPYLLALRRPLITGRDLARLGLPPGPAYREILESAREAQAVGKYTNRAAALRWAQRTFRQLSGKGTLRVVSRQQG